MEETVNYSQLTKERTIYFRDGTTSSMKLYMGVDIAPEKCPRCGWTQFFRTSNLLQSIIQRQETVGGI